MAISTKYPPVRFAWACTPFQPRGRVMTRQPVCPKPDASERVVQIRRTVMPCEANELFSTNQGLDPRPDPKTFKT